jgi:hypothetical protein
LATAVGANNVPLLIHTLSDRNNLLQHSVTSSIMASVMHAEKILKKMKANPQDWRIERLKSVAEANNIAFRQPGGSHVIFRHANGAMLSVPAHRPIKSVYIKKFVRLIEYGVTE